jgi:hypothetical protein
VSYLSVGMVGWTGHLDPGVQVALSGRRIRALEGRAKAGLFRFGDDG